MQRSHQVKWFHIAPGVRVMKRSWRRRNSSTQNKTTTDNNTMIVATASMVSVISCRIPDQINRGSVIWSSPPRNITTTTSSNEVTNAKSAPVMIPGKVSGNMTFLNVFSGRAPRLYDARTYCWSNPIKVAVTVITTKGVPSAAWAKIRPRWV